MSRSTLDSLRPDPVRVGPGVRRGSGFIVRRLRLAFVLGLAAALMASGLWGQGPSGSAGRAVPRDGVSTAEAVPAATAASACVRPASGGAPRLFADSIGIVFGREVPERLVAAAVERWSRCAGYGTDFPPFVVGARGTQTVEIRFARSSSAGARCGSFRGRTVDLYAFARDGRGRRLHCGSRVDGLVHELGHALGLGDAPGGAGCTDHAMAHIDAAARDRREIQPAECRAAGDRWLTRREASAAAAIGHGTGAPSSIGSAPSPAPGVFSEVEKSAPPAQRTGPPLPLPG